MLQLSELLRKEAELAIGFITKVWLLNTQLVDKHFLKVGCTCTANVEIQ